VSSTQGDYPQWWREWCDANLEWAAWCDRIVQLSEEEFARQLRSLQPAHEEGLRAYVHARNRAEKERVSPALSSLRDDLPGKGDYWNPVPTYDVGVPEPLGWFHRLRTFSDADSHRLREELLLRSGLRLRELWLKQRRVPYDDGRHESEWAAVRARLRLEVDREREHQRLLTTVVAGNTQTRTYHRIDGCHVPISKSRRFRSVYEAWAYGFRHCKNCGEQFSPRRGYAAWGSRFG
jgi:hypothetical protein